MPTPKTAPLQTTDFIYFLGKGPSDGDEEER
jgi:hypothetical protein